MIELDRPGHCSGCGSQLKCTDQTTSSLTNTSDGEKTVRRIWHQACWNKRAAQSFQRWRDSLIK